MASNGRTGYTGSNGVYTDATTGGVGMLVHQFLLEDPDADLIKNAAPYLAGLAEQTGPTAATPRISISGTTVRWR